MPIGVLLVSTGQAVPGQVTSRPSEIAPAVLERNLDPARPELVTLPADGRRMTGVEHSPIVRVF